MEKQKNEVQNEKMKNETNSKMSKVEETKNVSSSQPNQPLKRKIVIEFDQNSINITRAEVSSNFELQAILENVLRKIATN